ncbi:LamG-like jellyroll fold domain-containing protein [Nostoc parmelioides]|uniref:LamG-like jellyroll fold domain-containing protein n=1 Tax=Nostoc parmelioides FACHB-3921 TaxID=2692909 RepID=A0ABR8BGP2_9NOSO|nr:LamG-like jellyroll fold domain-containing protein [Nostoc parmelioides]MBD2252704.1 hypothetical protein [Nostoc parmelioides FACHB-3921]
MQPQWDNYLQSYTNKVYQYTTLVEHTGVLISLAMDRERRIYYTVLDQQNRPLPIDARNWSPTPELLTFPNEIAEVGFGIIPNKVLPSVKTNGEPAVNRSEVDVFRSSTARLTADAPFQALSDGQYVYLFRQSVDEKDANNITIKGADSKDIPIVNNTLLVDRFILSGNKLKTSREVRYRRSRNKILKSSAKDTLGAIDMNNRPFYEPTLELNFIRNLNNGRFAVVQVPTGIPDIKRWQIFVHNQKTNRLDAYNIERSSDGLFNTKGTESPAAFEKLGFAETALRLDGNTYIEAKSQIINKDEFNISAWIKPETTGVIYSEGMPNAIFTVSVVATEILIDGQTIPGYGLEVTAYNDNAKKSQTLRSLPNVINMGQWNHISISLVRPTEPNSPANSGLVRIQVGDKVINAGGRENQYLLLPKYPINSTQRTYLVVGRNVSSLYGGTQPASSLTATIDELSIWGRERSEIEVAETQNIRKAGNEPGLITYWQFDEGNGQTVYDQTDSLNNGTILGNLQWLQSDAPVGDNPGIRRCSFSFSDSRTVAGKGISALLYYQQEELSAGYDNNPAPTKQSARVMVAVATGKANNDQKKVAVLDFAVTKRGRLSQVPDVINLPLIDITAKNPNIYIERINQLEQIEIPNTKNAIASLESEIDNQMRIIATLEQNLSQKQQLKTNLANNGVTVYSLPSFEGQQQRLQVGEHSRLSIPIFSVDLDAGAYIILYDEPNFGGSSRVEYQDGRRYGGTYSISSYQSAKVRLTDSTVSQIDLYNSQINQIQQEITKIRTETIPDLQKQLDVVRERLQTLQAELLDKRKQLQGKFAFPMRLIHIDPSGLNVVGGLLDFAWTNDAPQLFESANGMVNLYFRGNTDQFFTVAYDTNVSRSNILLSNSVKLQERSPGLGRSEMKVIAADDTNLDGTTVNIADSLDANVCKLTLTNSSLQITEIWDRVPRNSGSFAKVLSGQAREVLYLGRLVESVTGTVDIITLSEPATQRYEVGAVLVIGAGTIPLRKAIAPGDKTIAVDSITLDATIPAGTSINVIEYDYHRYSSFSNQGTALNSPYNLKYGSILVEVAGLTNANNIENIATRPLTGVSQPNAWVTAAPGNALKIETGHLIGDANRMANQGDISLEAWIRPERRDINHAWIVSENSPTSNYCLGIQNQDVNSGLQFNGTNDYIEAGNINLLNQSFTIEFWAKREAASVTANTFFSAILSQGIDRTNEQLHIGFRQNHRFSFGFYRNDLNTEQDLANDDQWHHYACTFDIQTRQRIIYRDGVEVAKDIAPTTYQGKGRLLIGVMNNPGKTFFFQGGIDEIRIWQGVRSAGEINIYKDCRLNGNEARLLVYYYFENRNVSDRTGNQANNGTIIGNPQQIKSPLKAYNVIAGVRNRYLSTSQILWTNSWEHIAATYLEAYALNFNGVDNYLDCGNQVALGVENQLSIELTLSLSSLDRDIYPLLQKGRLGRNQPELTAWMALKRDSGSNYSLYFAYENSNSEQRIVSSPVNSISLNTAIKIAVTAIKIDNGYSIRLYWNGTLLNPNAPVLSGVPVTNLQSLELGKCFGVPTDTPQGKRIVGSSPNYLRGTISELRVWNRALTANEVQQGTGDRSKLAGEWLINEGVGNTTINTIDNSEARILGASWVVDPNPTASKLELYLNGIPAQTNPISEPNLTLNEFNLGKDYFGEMDEIRIWKQSRTPEQILDNLFGQIKGEWENLIAYYEFESDPVNPAAQEPQVTRVNDSSLRGNHLTPSANSTLKQTLSQAPIGDEIALVRNALGSIANRFHGKITSRPGIGEYADIQTGNNGEITGVHKRCYSFIDNGQWYLLTGYKVGNLITEWVSQVQFAPQIKGYIEGAPPVPSENLTAGPIDDSVRDYVDSTTVEFVEADSVSYTLSAIRDSSFNSSFEASLSGEVSQHIDSVTAPLGFGIITRDILAASVKLGASAKLDTELKWSSNQQQSNQTNVSKMTSVGLGGAWEDPDINKRLNKAMPRRYQPSNLGFALVESETADMYAIRLAHNRALVSFRMIPNPNIPKDTNIIPFPIKPDYTKQGTLDGAVGYDQNGKVLDPDYRGLTGYREQSYFKPSEAYTLRQRIQSEETRLRTYYEDFRTTPPGAAGIGVGADNGTIASLAAGGPTGLAVGIAITGLVDALTNNNNLPEQYSKRNLVNSYIWTADGGLYAESTETTDVQQESTSGAYSFTGNGSINASGSFAIGSVTLDLEAKASFGGSLNLTKSKTKEASQSFKIEVKNNTQADLQRFQMDDRGNLMRDEVGRPIRVYDANGNPLDAPGKVNAYRFLSFYLTPNTENYDTFFNTVVDRKWLEESNSPNAIALRQARQPQGGPACWRIFHRVTFVSRILPEFPDPTAPPLDRAIENTDLSSSYELIKLVEPFVRNATAHAAQFDAAARNAIRVYLPELSEGLTQEVVLTLANYFGVEGLN